VVVGYDEVVRVDVGQNALDVCAVDVKSERLLDQETEVTKAAIRKVFDSAYGLGEALLLVDQLHSISALAMTLVQLMGLEAAYLSGLSMRRLADLHPGKSKTDTVRHSSSLMQLARSCSCCDG